LDFELLCPKIERAIDRTARAYLNAQGMILTEEDLRVRLIHGLECIPSLNRFRRSQDRHIRASSVHAQLSWYDEDRRLTIVPDITILDPAHLSILHGYAAQGSQPQWLAAIPREAARGSRVGFDLFSGSAAFSPGFRQRSGGYSRYRPLPSKQFEFGGNAITLELKFARQGSVRGLLRGVRGDFEKMERLFKILDGRGEGHTIFSYIVIFDKYQQKRGSRAFAEFLRSNAGGYRHRIIYKCGNLTKEGEKGQARNIDF
jgi:hypothetical protein